MTAPQSSSPSNKDSSTTKPMDTTQESNPLKRPLESTNDNTTSTDDSKTSEPPTKKQKLSSSDDASSSTSTKATSKPTSQLASIEIRNEGRYGIKLYLSSHFPQMRGITKQRRSDFHVHEVSSEKEVAMLTSRDETKQGAKKESQDIRMERIKNGVEELSAYCKLSAEERKQFELFVANVYPPRVPDVPKHFYIEHPDVIGAKETRTTFFKMLRKWFDKELSAKFELDETDKSKKEEGAPVKGKIKITYFSSTKKQRKWDYEHDYVRFACFKENLTTSQAVHEISKACKVHRKAISFAGSKDKRGVTTQFMTAQKVLPQALAAINKSKRRYGTLKLGTFSWADAPFSLGDLWGNRFTMCIRRLEVQEDSNDKNSFREPTLEEMEERVNSLKTNGFINYYGMQRFGTFESPTFTPAIQYLKGNIWEALQTVLMARTVVDPQLKTIMDEWMRTKDYREVLRKINRKKYREESAILSALNRDPSNYDGAFKQISNGIQTMYFHSYQSYVWNWMVTKRIEKYGTKPVVGDLVYAEGSSHKSKSKDAEVVVLTEENVSKYNIFDVVMPLPGTQIEYPEHDLNKQAYVDFMAQDEITLDHFEKVRSDYRLYGSYRNIIVQPEDVQFELKTYTDFRIPMLLNDMEKAKNESLPEQPPATDANPAKKVLVLSFSLPSSSYATMCNRELLHLSSTLEWDKLNEKGREEKNGSSEKK